MNIMLNQEYVQEIYCPIRPNCTTMSRLYSFILNIDNSGHSGMPCAQCQSLYAVKLEAKLIFIISIIIKETERPITYR